LDGIKFRGCLGKFEAVFATHSCGAGKKVKRCKGPMGVGTYCNHLADERVESVYLGETHCLQGKGIYF